MKDNVILITGGTSGIGLALARELGKAGGRIAFTSRDAARCAETEKQLQSEGIEALGIEADASSEQDQYKAVAQTINRYGRLDVLINNAGISMRALFGELDLEVFRKVMDINFFGTVYATKAALPWLKKSKGSIVGISSVAGFKGLPGRTAYSASKFAMEGFLETVRTENIKKGLHVLIVCPGFTATDIRSAALNEQGIAQGETPLDESKLMTAAEVSSAIYHAVRKRKRDLILTVNGKLTVLLNKFFPKWLDKVVYNHMAKEPDSPFK